MNETKRRLIQSWLTKARNDLTSAQVLGDHALPRYLIRRTFHPCSKGAIHVQPNPHASRLGFD